MKNRPKIELEMSPMDTVLEYGAWFVLALIWGLVLLHYGSMPDEVPMQFSFSGEVQSTGSKLTLFIAPVVATLVIGGLYWLQKIPHTYNYTVKITEENARYQYTIAVRLMRTLRFSTGLMFLILEYVTMQVALKESEGISPFLVPVILLLILVPVGYYIVQASKKKPATS